MSGNRCAFPGCNHEFLGGENETNSSNICHIEDANRSLYKNDRHNPKQTDKERSDYNNLILLCPNHHIETNDPNSYTVTVLKRMKKDHENKIRSQLNDATVLPRYASILGTLINRIALTSIEEEFDTDTYKVPDTEAKIQYNNLIEYKYIIEEYSVYQGKLNSIFEEIEKDGSAKKTQLLRNIRNLYLKQKGKYPTIEDVRENADQIFENIKEQIWLIISKRDNMTEDLDYEVIENGICIVMVDAFMRCKIFEAPV